MIQIYEWLVEVPPANKHAQILTLEVLMRERTTCLARSSCVRLTLRTAVAGGHRGRNKNKAKRLQSQSKWPFVFAMTRIKNS